MARGWLGGEPSTAILFSISKCFSFPFLSSFFLSLLQVTNKISSLQTSALSTTLLTTLDRHCTAPCRDGTRLLIGGYTLVKRRNTPVKRRNTPVKRRIHTGQEKEYTGICVWMRKKGVCDWGTGKIGGRHGEFSFPFPLFTPFLLATNNFQEQCSTLGSGADGRRVCGFSTFSATSTQQQTASHIDNHDNVRHIGSEGGRAANQGRPCFVLQKVSCLTLSSIQIFPS
jgi:hypothetical protein